MYYGKKVSIVFATYKEKKSIKNVINSFWNTNYVDEIIVVNNNAQSGTDKEVKKTRANIIYEKKQGYGYAFQTALKSATGELIVVCEPDGTFTGNDLERFLVYSRDFDVVLGSRTSLIPSLRFAGMGVIRKFANVLEAKTIEVLFNTNALTDVGCAYKLFHRKALNKLISLWRGHKSPLFNTELVLLVVSYKIPFVEIPVTYKRRIGKSTVVDNWLQALRWAYLIQFYIIYYWLTRVTNKLVRKFGN